MGSVDVAAVFRACDGDADFPIISDYLYSLYQSDNRDGNWLQPIWEYAYTHPWFDDEAVSRIGIWEDAGAIVAVVMFELRLGEAFFQVHPKYAHLKPAMLAHAEKQLSARDDQGRRYLKAYVNDWDSEFEDETRARGFVIDPASERLLSKLTIPDPFPPIDVPEGFRIKSLADDNDLTKVHRVLWRGFDHPGEPPPEGIEGRKKMQSGSNYRKDTTIVVEAPNGDFAAFAGLWLDPVNRICYVEPVATDPDYRRKSLGTAAVLAGIRRCGELGATVAFVGSERKFYRSMGFKKLYTQNCWSKSYPDNETQAAA
jgi:GNAT superfamily N-acetyltransferase